MTVGFIFNDNQTFMTTPSENERIKTPSLKDNSVIIRNYLYPYVNGTVNRYTEKLIRGFGINSYNKNTNIIHSRIPIYLALLDEPISLQPREEFEILFSISWGRYEDPIEGVV